MTTHDEQTETTSARTPIDEPTTETESESAHVEPTATEAPASAEARTSPPEDVEDEKPLFADGTLSGLRSRWDDVQAAFVDDPKECVQKADALVGQVVEQLTTGFAETRARLEAQWSRGESASTEDLRVALKRYRDFFQRLLSA